MATNKRKYESITSPKGVFKFPRINEPDEKYNKFSCKVVITGPEGEALIEKLKPISEAAVASAKEKLQEQMAGAKGEKLAKLKKAVKEISEGNLPVKPTYNDQGEEDGGYEVTFSAATTFKDKNGNTVERTIGIYDAKGQLVKNRPSIWGGTVGRCNGIIKQYYNPATNSAGVSLGLAAVQVIELVSGGQRSGASLGFAAEEGGFVAEDVPEADAPAAPAAESTSDSPAGGDDF